MLFRYRYNIMSTYTWAYTTPGREGTLDWKLNWYPRFIPNYLSLKLLGTCDWLVPNYKCPNFSTTYLNLQNSCESSLGMYINMLSIGFSLRIPDTLSVSYTINLFSKGCVQQLLKIKTIWKNIKRSVKRVKFNKEEVEQK